MGFVMNIGFKIIFVFVAALSVGACAQSPSPQSEPNAQQPKELMRFADVCDGERLCMVAHSYAEILDTELSSKSEDGFVLKSVKADGSVLVISQEVPEQHLANFSESRRSDPGGLEELFKLFICFDPELKQFGKFVHAGGKFRNVLYAPDGTVILDHTVSNCQVPV